MHEEPRAGNSNSIEDIQRLQKNQKTFDNMQKEFVNSVESESLQRMNISNIYENMYCVCEWQDKVYYRAIILKCDYANFTAHVRYIDFGNEESVDFDKIFDLHEYYYSIPEHTLCCKLKDYVVNYDLMIDDTVPNSDDIVSDRLYDHFLNSNRKIYAKFFKVLVFFLLVFYLDKK